MTIDLQFVTMHNIPETAVRVFRRHLQMYPDNSEHFIEYLVSVERLDEARRGPRGERRRGATTRQPTSRDFSWRDRVNGGRDPYAGPHTAVRDTA